MQDQTTRDATKTCADCRGSKPLTAFGLDRNRKDGLRLYCKPCKSEQARVYRTRNRDAIALRRKERDRERLASDPDYRERKRATYQRWYLRNPGASGRWRDKNKESTRATVQAWRDANREHQRAYARQWGKDNPERVRANNASRRAWRVDAFVEHVHSLVVLERDDGACGICGGDVDPQNFHVDHIIPLSRGGEHSYANTQAAHPSCNRKKHDNVERIG